MLRGVPVRMMGGGGEHLEGEGFVEEAVAPEDAEGGMRKVMAGGAVPPFDIRSEISDNL